MEIMEPELTTVTAGNVPVRTLDALRPHAALDGFGRTDSAVVRWALSIARRSVYGEPIQGRDPGDETKGDA